MSATGASAGALQATVNATRPATGSRRDHVVMATGWEWGEGVCLPNLPFGPRSRQRVQHPMVVLVARHDRGACRFLSREKAHERREHLPRIIKVPVAHDGQ